jgi:type II secretory pathway pseudopilin PulG
MLPRVSAILNKSGVSLVEVLIALVISLLVFLAVMQTALVGIDANMRNVLRDEAVNIAEMRLREARSVPFAALLSKGPDVIQRDVRKITNFQFTVNDVVDEIDGDQNTATDDGDIRRATVTVNWQWKGQNFRHMATTIRKRE